MMLKRVGSLHYAHTVSAIALSLISSGSAWANGPRNDTESGSAAAQSTANSNASPTVSTDDSEIGEIIVTAQKRSESINRVGLWIGVQKGPR
ncbi:hypothetical protein FHS92_000001 [Sphingobium subterraneum]|uniref:TonB-dependent receptor n=1 Tax=Sphingobium subterraneum TaxID=627688 RepID=A0A841IVD0_9SPHN|nr:hypothetical protein [Sphingobium subterraneum]